MELGKSYSRVSISTSAGGTGELIAASGTLVNRLHGLYVSPSTDALLKIESGSSVGSTDVASLAGDIALVSRTPFTMPFIKVREGVLSSAAGKNLQVTSTAGTLGGWATVSQSTA